MSEEIDDKGTEESHFDVEEKGHVDYVVEGDEESLTKGDLELHVVESVEADEDPVDGPDEKLGAGG